MERPPLYLSYLKKVKESHKRSEGLNLRSKKIGSSAQEHVF